MRMRKKSPGSMSRVTVPPFVWTRIFCALLERRRILMKSLRGSLDFLSSRLRRQPDQLRTRRIVSL